MKQTKWPQIFSQFILWISLTLAKESNGVEPPLFTKQSKYLNRQSSVYSRMPRNIDSKIFGSHDFTQFPALPPNLPMQGFPSFPGIPGFQSKPISGPMYGPDRPMLLPMPGPMPGFNPMSMPMPMRGQRNKQPVIVYHQKLRSSKKEKSRHQHHSADYTSNESDDTTDSTGSEDIDQWNGKNKKKMKKNEIKRRSNSHHHHYNEHRKQHHHHRAKAKKKTDLLTPMLQYVTKDGYVIFETKISKQEANDWLASKELQKVNKEELGVKKDAELLRQQKHKIKTMTVKIDDIIKKREKDSLERSAEINAIKESSQTEPPRQKNKRKKKMYYTHSSDLGHNFS